LDYLHHWIFSIGQATAKKKARATEKSQADKVEEDSEDKENGNVAPAKRRRVETYELHCYLVNYTIDQRRLGVLRSTHVLSKSSFNLSNSIAYINKRGVKQDIKLYRCKANTPQVRKFRIK
jgi:hypothetical protein